MVERTFPAHPIALATWVGSANTIPKDTLVEVLNIDSLYHDIHSNAACWIRWTTKDNPFPNYTTCEYADLIVKPEKPRRHSPLPTQESSDFFNLAQRWLSATKPDRQLDADTAIATGWIHKHNIAVWGIGAPHWYKDGKSASEIIGWWFNGPNGHKTSLPYFTASMDAVLTLIPDEFVWSALTDYELPGRARVSNTHSFPGIKVLLGRADAATPVLSLGAAAMFAHHENHLMTKLNKGNHDA